MEDRSAVLLGVVAGAVVGGAVAYLFLSENGRKLREELAPAVADLARELQRSQATAGRAADAVKAAGEAWAARG